MKQPAKPKRGRPPSGGRYPIRGQMRWSDDDWRAVQSALREGESFAEFARAAILAAVKRRLKGQRK
jgi:hypothetical protein